MDGQDIISVPRACRKRIESFFASVDKNDTDRYIQDWQTITPRNDREHINRYRFAYCTVHTSWANSVDQYNAIKRTNADTTYNSLLRMLKNSQGGMYQIKATGIDHLQSLWTNNRQLFNPQPDNWQTWRTKLSNNLKKLGLAKTSFAIEMIRPLDAQIICIDRHMFKAFGWENVDQACSYDQYKYYEDYWNELSNHYDIPPVISRNMFWDQIQQQPDSMYWAKYLN